MEEKSEQDKVKLKEPYNPMDPIVVFDPEFEPSSIVVGYSAETKGDSVEAEPTAGAQTKIEAIRFPLIKLNNIILQEERVKKLTICIKDFLPTIHLEAMDKDGSIQATDVPGLNNVITVVLIAPVDGANKKISIDFYITSCSFDNGIGIYDGEYKLIALQQAQCKQIGSEALSTYDMLSEIAKECKLGFAASDGCKDIADKKWRQVYSDTYKNYIQQQLEFAGLDENSVFNAWVDEFGYLVMMNEAKAFLDDVDQLQLTIKAIKGEQATEKNDKENTVEEVQRLITNVKSGGVDNMHFESQTPIVSNSSIKENGTLKTIYFMSGAADDNTISTKQVQIIEDSIDGREGIADYTYETKEFIGIDMSDDSNQLYQKQIVKANRLKYFSEQLKIEMTKPNYSIQRGMLICVGNYEYNTNNKNVLLANKGNSQTLKPNIDNTQNDVNKDDLKKTIEDDSVPVMNESISGVYYVNGIEFNWNSGDLDIKQYLYIVKKGIRNKVYNKLTVPKNIKRNS